MHHRLSNWLRWVAAAHRVVLAGSARTVYNTCVPRIANSLITLLTHGRQIVVLLTCNRTPVTCQATCQANAQYLSSYSARRAFMLCSPIFAPTVIFENIVMLTKCTRRCNRRRCMQQHYPQPATPPGWHLMHVDCTNFSWTGTFGQGLLLPLSSFSEGGPFAQCLYLRSRDHWQRMK